MFKYPASKQQSYKLHQALVRNRSGNVTIAFGFSALVMFATGGGAIDFARWFQVKSKLHAALDAASLAGGRALQLSAGEDHEAGIAAAKRYFEKMKPANVGGSDPVFTVIENGTVMRAEGNFTMEAPFLGMVGIPYLKATVTTEAAIAVGSNAGTNLEISLMLDVTGSMAGQKIEDLKLAAKDLIDIVVWSDQSRYTSKVALAPFSSRVNVGPYLEKVSGVKEEKNFGGTTLKGITCVTDRTGTEALTDAKPVAGATLSAYRGDTGNTARDNAWNYSATGECAVPEILPLTSDKDALKARIDSLPATGSTAGALGTAWAWYLLSPKWTGIWHVDNMPAPYSDIKTLDPKGLPKLQKVVVLMTDGIYNTTGGTNHGDGSTESTTISNRALSICNNMKAPGVDITVYTVGFHLGDNQLAIDTLRNCASRADSDPVGYSSYFFNTTTGDELRGAFRHIALQLSTLRLRS